MGGAEGYSRQREQHDWKPRGRRVSAFREGGRLFIGRCWAGKLRLLPSLPQASEPEFTIEYFALSKEPASQMGRTQQTPFKVRELSPFIPPSLHPAF